MKFKVGDLVCYKKIGAKPFKVHLVSEDYNGPTSDYYTINFMKCWVLDVDLNWYREKDVEFYAVWNSPLYGAMTE